MALQARVIGPKADLGDFETLNFFGNEIGRDWTDVNFGPDQYEKAKGNRYIEVKGSKPKDGEAAAEDAAEQDEEDVMRARLAELGVSVDGRASASTLRSKLDAAEKAEAKRQAEEDDLRAQLGASEAQ